MRSGVTMRKTAAFILAGVGLILAVGVPVTIALLFNIDLGKQPAYLVGGMIPGLSVMVLARRLWKGAKVPKPTPDQIASGYQVCDLCGKTVAESEGLGVASICRRQWLALPLYVMRVRATAQNERCWSSCCSWLVWGSLLW